MKQLSIKVTVADYVFTRVVDVEIESSYKSLTDQASILLPRLLKLNNQTISTDKIIKRGDEIQIEIGYNFDNQLIYSGYIEEIINDVTIELKCTDSYQLKLNRATKTFRKATVEDVLNEVSPIDFETIDIEIGNFKITNATALQTLNALRKDYNIKSWLRDGKLYTGLAFFEDLQSTIQFNLNGSNGDVIDSDLQYRSAEERRISVEATSILKDNTKLSVNVGDSDGEKRTLTYYGIESEAALKKIAEDQLSSFKYDGYEGSFLTFGTPIVEHGDIVELVDNKYKERTGKYIVEKVVTTFGSDGYRQQIYLDAKV